MSEITKLYENAGLSNMWVQRYNDGYYEHERYYNSYKEMIRNMMEVNNWTLVEAQEVAKKECKKEHPPFTAEKQIKLIKWLCKRGLLNVMYSKDKNTYHLFNDRCIGAFCYDIATAIATLVQCELDFCSPEEKQQVKGILK